jgi:hypothetical protein
VTELLVEKRPFFCSASLKQVLERLPADDRTAGQVLPLLASELKNVTRRPYSRNARSARYLLRGEQSAGRIAERSSATDGIAAKVAARPVD